MKRILTERLTTDDLKNNELINRTLTTIQEKGYQLNTISIRENRLTIEYDDYFESGMNKNFHQQESINLDKATGFRLLGRIPMMNVFIIAGIIGLFHFLI